MSKKLISLDPQRRDTILNAALKEFSSQGFDNASTNVIAKEAGISKAPMFHYVSSKQELFLVVYDYFSELIRSNFLELMNYDEKDIFVRLRQSYILQIELSKKYPWILEFNKLSGTTNSIEVNNEENTLNHEALIEKLDGYFDELRKIFYAKSQCQIRFHFTLTSKSSTSKIINLVFAISAIRMSCVITTIVLFKFF